MSRKNEKKNGKAERKRKTQINGANKKRKRNRKDVNEGKSNKIERKQLEREVFK